MGSSPNSSLCRVGEKKPQRPSLTTLVGEGEKEQELSELNSLKSLVVKDKSNLTPVIQYYNSTVS